MKILPVLIVLFAGILFPAFLNAQQGDVFELRQDIKIVHVFGLFEAKKPDKRIGDINIGLTLRGDKPKQVIIMDLSLSDKLKRDHAYMFLFDIDGTRKLILNSANRDNIISSSPNSPKTINKFYETPDKGNIFGLAIPFENNQLKFSERAPSLELNLNPALIGYDNRIPMVLYFYYGKVNEFCGEYMPITIVLQLPEETKQVEKPVAKDILSQPYDQSSIKVNSQSPEMGSNLKTGPDVIVSLEKAGGGGVALAPAQEASAKQLFDECRKVYNELFEMQSNPDGKTIEPGMLDSFRNRIDQLKTNYDQLMKELVITDFRKKRQLDEFYDYYDGAGSIIDELNSRFAGKSNTDKKANIVGEKKKKSEKDNLKIFLVALVTILLVAGTILFVVLFRKNASAKRLMLKNKPPIKPNLSTSVKPPQPRPTNFKI